MTHPYRISATDIRRAVLNLTHNVEGVHARVHEGGDVHMQALLKDLGGWNIVEVLKTAAACALVKQLPFTHPDVALVIAQLREYGYGTSNAYAPSVTDDASPSGM